jgi:hypothetical protein
LKRFTISSKVITKISKRSMIVRMLVERNGCVEPIQRFITTHHHVEWPVQALSEILPNRNSFLNSLLWRRSPLQAFTPPEHKADLIRAMRGHVTPEIASVLRQFLSDDDDDVRIAAIEATGETESPCASRGGPARNE